MKVELKSHIMGYTDVKNVLRENPEIVHNQKILHNIVNEVWGELGLQAALKGDHTWNEHVVTALKDFLERLKPSSPVKFSTSEYVVRKSLSGDDDEKPEVALFFMELEYENDRWVVLENTLSRITHETNVRIPQGVHFVSKIVDADIPHSNQSIIDAVSEIAEDIFSKIRVVNNG